MGQVGFVDGRHYVDWVDDVKSLLRLDPEAAETVLLRLLDAVEAEAAVEGDGVAPWYYERLAILYAKKKNHAAEVAILERFARQPHAPGVLPAKLLARLTKARILRAANS